MAIKDSAVIDWIPFYQGETDPESFLEQNIAKGATIYKADYLPTTSQKIPEEEIAKMELAVTEVLDA